MAEQQEQQEQQQLRPYIHSLSHPTSYQNSYLYATVHNLGPREQYPFRRLNSVQVIRLLETWRNGQLPNDHMLKNLSVYSYLPDHLYRFYGLGPTDRRPLWYLTHLFKQTKDSFNENRSVLYDHCRNAHWVPLKEELIEHNDHQIGHKMKLALWAEKSDGLCVKTEYRMEEFRSHENPDPDPDPDQQQGMAPEDLSGLYKHGDWIIAKIYKARTRRQFLFGSGTFELYRNMPVPLG